MPLVVPTEERKTSLMKGSGCDPENPGFVKNSQLDLAKNMWVLIKYKCCPRGSSRLQVLDPTPLRSLLVQVSTGVPPVSGIRRVFWS